MSETKPFEEPPAGSDDTVPSSLSDEGSTLRRLLEIQHFDRIPRTGFLQRGVSPAESVSEHSWHVAFLVAEFGPEVPGLDLAKALQLALVHDLAELRTGDLPKPAARDLPAGAKSRMEEASLAALLPWNDRVPTKTSLEGRFVKACDLLQLALKAEAYWCAGWRGVSDLRAQHRPLPEAIAPFASLIEIWRALSEEASVP